MNQLYRYQQIFCQKDMSFLKPYLSLPSLNRLKTIDQFCGCYYTNLHPNIRFFYSRFNHSITTSLMTYHFTNSKKQALAALFHDINTPAFSHTIDYLLNDRFEQNSSEKLVNNLENDLELTTLLAKDGLTKNDISNLKKYPVVENEKPKLCVDRLDGVLHTGYIWQNFWSLNDIKTIYDDLIFFEKINEIGFKNEEIALKFMKGVKKYSIALQKLETNYTLDFIAFELKKLLDKNIIIINDLFKYSEAEIIEFIKSNNYLRWQHFIEAKRIIKTNQKPSEFYTEWGSKKRYVDPLVSHKNDIKRLSLINKEAKKLLEDYFNFEEPRYAYIKKL